MASPLPASTAPTVRVQISVCMGSSCFARGNNSTLHALQEYLKTHHLEGQVEVRGLLCQGACAQGPNMVIDGTPYGRVEPSALVALLEHHLHPPGSSR